MSSAVPASTKTVLCVDDDVDYLAQEELQLKAAGYTVLTAGNEKEAIEALAKRTPDLIVLDLMMEQMDGGFTLCHQFKRKYPKLPIILVTGVTHETGMNFEANSPEQRAWVKADAILTKPVRGEQLLKEVSRLLKG